MCKRRGFIYPGSDIYGGLAGSWDFGPLGVELKRRIKDLWWQTFVINRSDIYGLESAILMSAKVWQASGHTAAGFGDPLVEDLVNQKRYRADHLLSQQGLEVDGLTVSDLNDLIKKHQINSPDGNQLSPVRQFNMMFTTQVGPTSHNKTYLRPETAQGMFVNFKNIIDSYQPDLPFGLAQIGKAFRNEISPRDFIFRTREFEQMEIEYFCQPTDRQVVFDAWQKRMIQFFELVGLNPDRLHLIEVPANQRAHYSQRTVDFEFDFPFGRAELAGLADRGHFDLNNHQAQSGVNLSYIDKQTQTKIEPVCIEPTFGLERLILALLTAAYRDDPDNQRIYLALKPNIAPIQYCVSPLLKNKPQLVTKAKQVYQLLRDKYTHVAWDDSGNIGRRYRRQDEIGTPYCVVVDFQTLDDDSVTVRQRDDLNQQRLLISDI